MTQRILASSRATRWRTLAPLAALLAAVVAGCAAPPAQRHETPALELPAGAATVPAVAPDWWKTFADPQLDALVAEALAHNRDLARAMARNRPMADERENTL